VGELIAVFNRARGRDMEKKKPYGRTPKEQYLADARDKLHNFLLADGALRGAILNGTRMVNEMRANHELGVWETLVLGRAYLGAALMASGLKGSDRLSVRIDCSGPIQGLVVEANAFGEVRGYLKQVPIPIVEPPADFDLSRFFGAGFLTVTRFPEGAKQPFSGQVELRYGNIAEDLAYYYFTSEQVPTAFNLSIKFDHDGEVTGAGGLFLQAMPQAEDRLAAELEKRVIGLPSIGEAFSAEMTAAEMVNVAFAPYAPKFLASRRVEFMCHCSRERLFGVLSMLPENDLKDLRDNGPFPMEMRCHNCNTVYAFEKPQIEALLERRLH
jgi:molecular chaperone Hsp33